jgi:uncharacterized repeat protein (TIGR03806 family)
VEARNTHVGAGDSPARQRHCSLPRAVTIALALILLLASFTGCNKLSGGPVHPFLDQPYPAKLSDWHLFVAHTPHLEPNQRVVPYDLNTPLFSDYASKYRFVWMPPNTSAAYHEDSVFDFPVGTIFAKSFAFPAEGHPEKERLIETRLLVHTKSGWVGLPYIWNESQTEAHLDLVPDPVPIRSTDSSGTKRDFTYFIPNANECKQCHDNNHAMQPIGLKARNLNKDFAYSDGTANQLAYWTKLGYLQGAPPANEAPKAAVWNDPNSGPLEARARAYLDNNCAHCHQPGGTAGYTGVDLRAVTKPMWGQPPPAVQRAQPASSTNADDRRTFGICKSPNSAGRVGTLTYDLVPGHPEQSILLARMQSVQPKEMMPQIGRSIVHAEGIALVRDWIQSLPTNGASCAKPPDTRTPRRGL